MSFENVVSKQLVNGISKLYQTAYSKDIPQELAENLRSTFSHYAEKKAEIIVVMNETEFSTIELFTFNSVSKLGDCIAKNNGFYHVKTKHFDVNKIDLEEAVELLNRVPLVPLCKTKKDLDIFVKDAFAEFGLDTYLDADNLYFSLEKSKELENTHLTEWICQVIESQRKLVIREEFNAAANASYDNLVQFNKVIRPLLKRLGFPNELMEHSFRELRAFDMSGWDNVISKNMDQLAKREFYYTQDETLIADALNDKNASTPINDNKWFNKPGVIACIGAVFVFCTFNVFYL